MHQQQYQNPHNTQYIAIEGSKFCPIFVHFPFIIINLSVIFYSKTSLFVDKEYKKIYRVILLSPKETDINGR